MKFNVNSPISLTAADPGWYVQHTSPKGGIHTYRIIAWAVVSNGYDVDGGMDSQIEPVFLYAGTPYTTSEWYRDMGTECALEVLAP